MRLRSHEIKTREAKDAETDRQQRRDVNSQRRKTEEIRELLDDHGDEETLIS